MMRWVEGESKEGKTARLRDAVEWQLVAQHSQIFPRLASGVEYAERPCTAYSEKRSGISEVDDEAQ